MIYRFGKKYLAAHIFGKVGIAPKKIHFIKAEQARSKDVAKTYGELFCRAVQEKRARIRR